MKHTIQTIMLAMALGCLWPVRAAAQQAQPAFTRAAVTTGSTLAAEGGSTFDLSFSGGTVQKLIIEMERASGQKLNVLIPPELADANVPPMELRSVFVRDVFDSLSMLWRNTMQWTRPSGVTTYGQPVTGNVWVLSRPPDNRKTQTFYVGHLLKKFKIDDITTAVQTTWQLGGKEAKAELKYHQDTQLLIALGGTEQLRTVAEVLGQLKLAVEPVRIDPEKADDTKGADDKKAKSAAQL